MQRIADWARTLSVRHAVSPRGCSYWAWVGANVAFGGLLLIAVIVAISIGDPENDLERTGAFAAALLVGMALMGLTAVNILALVVRFLRRRVGSKERSDGVAASLLELGPATIRKTAPGRAFPRLTAEPRVKIPPGEEVVIYKFQRGTDWVCVKRRDGTLWWVEAKRLRSHE